MSFRLICYVLFDITQTGVNDRRSASEYNSPQWIQRRDTQCNFDTVIQAISLRSQPEDITIPVRADIKFTDDRFGFLFVQTEDEEYPCWSFSFNINHPGVFDKNGEELGLLYDDCDMVPMIKCGTEWDKLPMFLDASDELRNIYFEVIHEETE